MSRLARFEQIVRRARRYTTALRVGPAPPHPFELRNIDERIPLEVRKLFDDGYFSQATFEACKFLDREVQRLAKSTESGWQLMMEAFGGASPRVRLNALLTASERDEQDGFKFLFGGATRGIRNPRGHDPIRDDPDLCLDHLGLISLLLRRLEDAGHRQAL